MQWARIYSIIADWPGDTLPPIFDISADENGTAEVELAWDPQALLSPATYQPNPLRYYSSASGFIETLKNANGTSRTVNIAPQTIQLSANHATWMIPQELWDAYIEETLKSLDGPSATAFACNLYYRVRIQPPGASQATVWPPDQTYKIADKRFVPHMGILRMSASLSSQVFPDPAAVAAMGGVPGRSTFWADVLLGLWRTLPESNPYRQVLMRLFAHPVFKSAPLDTRAALLKLWLFAGKEAGLDLIRLLDRNVVVGNNQVQSIILKPDSRGKTLVENLLALVFIDPHPELKGVISKEQLVDQVVKEILDPNGQINQGPAGTCAPTSLQTLLITVNPAEYARLQVGLLSKSASTTLANGATISVPPMIYAAGQYMTVQTRGTRPEFIPFRFRTYPELGFQIALLKYSQGSRFPTLTGSPEDITKIFLATIEAGLFFNEIEKALDALFNAKFKTHQVPSETAKVVLDGFLSELSSRPQPLILGMEWGAKDPNTGRRGGHAVMAVRRESGSSRVFFKNPQYPGSDPVPGARAGGLDTDPPRRYEDPTQSLESMTEADLLTWILAYWVPDKPII